MANFERMTAEDNFDNMDDRYTHTIDERLDDPAYYDNVRTRRILAFIVDYIAIAILPLPRSSSHCRGRIAIAEAV